VILEATGFDVFLLSSVPDPERADEATAVTAEEATP